MRKRIILALVAFGSLYVAFGAAAWLMPARLGHVVGPDLVAFGQAIGIPVFWALSAGVNVVIMAGIIGLFALIGWMLSPRAR